MHPHSTGQGTRFRIITIDGPAGVGKTTAAKALSKKIRFFFLDTGALYRAMALHLIRRGVSPDVNYVLKETLDSLDLRIEVNVGGMLLYLQGEEISSLIRTEEISAAASKFSALTEVRESLLPFQRETAHLSDTVAEGRDMGTVVFPDADLKFFLTADLAERAHRRYIELMNRGGATLPEDVEADIRRRDERDAGRATAPLVQPRDAVCIDTTYLTVDQVLERLLSHTFRRGLLSGSHNEP